MEQYCDLTPCPCKHLLPIGSHQGIAIVTAREVFDRLGATGKT